jgi:hypothetical protein
MSIAVSNAVVNLTGPESRMVVPMLLIVKYRKSMRKTKEDEYIWKAYNRSQVLYRWSVKGVRGYELSLGVDNSVRLQPQ